ncbi:Site-specific recombinase XerD [Rhizobiales bacterium GAS113]|nr:Site-specific recombinase XerD [Rhizobiales bacterium GAS113]
MDQKLSDSIVKGLPVPARGNRVHYDSEVKGFGCRVTTGGTRSFILNYRTRAGRERRFTIGQFPTWKAAAARAEASELKKRIDRGEDPLADVEASRDAKTVADLCGRFAEEYLPRKRASTQRDYKRAIDTDIIPGMKHLKVAEVTFSDIDGLHRKITKRGAPYVANRTVALLSKMFAQAIRWKWRADNPAKGVERNHEEKRQRYLTPAELAGLTKALAEHADQQAANIVRLLLLTGARKSEVLSMQWEHLDLAAGVWTKPSAHTKQKATHRVPLSAPAMLLLSELRGKRRNDEGAKFVFPGRSEGHRVEFKRAWAELCIAAAIVTTEKVEDAKGERMVLRPSARIHDLRHTYASVLASAGQSLPIIGALLGHTQPATTARYAHLFDDPLRQATERVAAVVSGKPSAEIVPIRGGVS